MEIVVNYVSAKDQVPPRIREDSDISDEVLVFLVTKEVLFDRYNHKYGTWIVNPRLVTHWAFKPIPKL